MSDNLAEAIALLRGAVDRAPGDPTVRQKLFAAVVRSGQFEEAVAEFGRLVKAQPEWAQFHFEVLGRGAAGRVAEIRDAFRAATTRDPADAVSWYGLGLASQLMRDQQAAAESFRHGLEADPQFASLHYNLGITLMDDPRQAAEHHELAVTLSPTIAEPHFPLGSLAMNHDRARAARHFREFIRLAPPYLAPYVQQAQLSLQILSQSKEDAT